MIFPPGQFGCSTLVQHMADMAGDFLQRSRHGTTYFFRRRVPADIQHVFKIAQLYRALATTDRRTAIVRARVLASRTDRLFEQVRAMGKKKEEVLQVGLILKLDQDELGLDRLTLQTEPHDTTEDKNRAFEAVQTFAESRQRVAADRTPTIPVDPGKPLSEAVEQFLAEGEMKPKTFRAYRTALRLHAIPFFGADTRTGKIDQELFAAFVSHVFADKRRAHSTKDGYINAFTSMFSWLRARHPKSTALLSTRKLIPANQDADSEQRDAFTMDHLHVLFGNVVRYRGKEPHKFWATVASAFMGLRIEELAQVNLNTDLLHNLDADIWYFALNEDADTDEVKRKSLKKAASRRVVPIHSALLKHGFLEYLQSEKEAGASRPFERGWKPWNEPKRGGVHWSHYISRWGGVELEKLHKTGRLDRTGLKLGYFHSARHTFASVLANAGVDEERRAALQGQVAVGAGENSKRYVKMRHDPVLLSGIVEKHLGAYAEMLDTVLAVA